MTNKHTDYFIKLFSGIQEIINDPENENYINLTEENFDATDFMYALGIMLPCYIYNNLTDEYQDVLEHNHMLNSLIMQYKQLKFEE